MVEKLELTSKRVIEEKDKNVVIGESEDMKKVKLKTSDKVIFEVELAIVEEMQTVQSFIDTGSNVTDDSVIILLPNVTSYYLNLIIQYYRKHLGLEGEDNNTEQDLKEFDERFVKGLNGNELKQLLLAVNYLNMQSFIDFLTRSMADFIKNKSPKFVRNFFGIINDYTPFGDATLGLQENQVGEMYGNRD